METALAHPFLHCLLFSSWSRIMPTMMSSETSPPASMIFLASTPSVVFFDTCSRSMSPVARWHTQNSSRIRGACVPLPIQARRRRRQPTEARQSQEEREETRTCARGPDKDGAELLRWRRLLCCRLCLELLNLVCELTYERLEIRKLVRG